MARSPSRFFFSFSLFRSQIQFANGAGRGRTKRWIPSRQAGDVTRQGRPSSVSAWLVVAHTCALVAASLLHLSLSLALSLPLSPSVCLSSSPSALQSLSSPRLPLVSSWLAVPRGLASSMSRDKITLGKSAFHPPFSTRPTTPVKTGPRAVVNYNGPAADAENTRNPEERGLREIAQQVIKSHPLFLRES